MIFPFLPCSSFHTVLSTVFSLIHAHFFASAVCGLCEYELSEVVIHSSRSMPPLSTLISFFRRLQSNFAFAPPIFDGSLLPIGLVLKFSLLGEPICSDVFFHHPSRACPLDSLLLPSTYLSLSLPDPSNVFTLRF
jgi:hypothetical protein